MKNADVRAYLVKQGEKVKNLEFIIDCNGEEEYIATVEDSSSDFNRYIGIMTNGKEVVKSFWISSKDYQTFGNGFITVAGLSKTSDEIFK